jgi:thioredoxin reductase (NADPH)
VRGIVTKEGVSIVDYDVIIIGGGPAGLTAAIYLGRSRYRVLLMEKGQFGGQLIDAEWIENYPGFSEGVAGAMLASEMVSQTVKYGAELELGEVIGIESFTDHKSVTCADGKRLTSAAVVIAGGARSRKLGVPGEDTFQGKGVIHCALCDGGKFVDRVVAVCGGGDAGVTEAIYLTNFSSRVFVIEALPALTATAVLREKAYANPKLEVRCGERIVQIIGDTRLKAIELAKAATGQKETLRVDGVLVRVGIEPNTAYLEGVIPLDNEGKIVVNNSLETAVPCVLAAGDIRKDSPQQAVTAVGDGAIAAMTAQRLLQVLK